jgi:signal transduction histidine kinase
MSSTILQMPSLMPHSVCWRADPHLIWVMVITNAITFLSYVSICLTLLYLVRKTRRILVRDWAYFAVGFALFIVACGSTHLMDVVTTWLPWFWIDAWTCIVTALLSAWVAVLLIRRAATIAFSINDYASRLANTEHEKRRMLDSLLAAQKLSDWSRMSTLVAHEIANPLEAVQNLLYLIRSGENVSDEVIHLAQTASDEADRVLTISRSTLSFFRSGTEPEPVDLLVAAEGLRFLLGNMIERKRIVLDIQATGDAIVDALPGEPRQVLLNLVRNACEATTTDGTHISLKLTGHTDAVDIVVSDHGSGIDPAILPNLFQFGVSSKGEQGNGMGLWSIKQILHRHGGTIQVESSLGKGTTFTLRWPRSYKTETND